MARQVKPPYTATVGDRRKIEDVALIGFDDIPLAHEMVPSLTTVRIALDEIGRRASRLVLGQLDKPERGPARTEVITPQLIRRATA